MELFKLKVSISNRPIYPSFKLIKLTDKYSQAYKNLEWDEFLREFKKGGYWFHLAMTSIEGKKRKKACNIARSGDPVDGQKLDRQYGMCGLTINRG
jgi:hypothetical protein